MAAIDEEFDGVDVTAVVGSEEDHGFSDFIEFTDPAGWNSADGAIGELLDLFVGEAERVFVTGRWNRAGADGIDADLAVLQINQPRAKERIAAFDAL